MLMSFGSCFQHICCTFFAADKDGEYQVTPHTEHSTDRSESVGSSGGLHWQVSPSVLYVVFANYPTLFVLRCITVVLISTVSMLASAEVGLTRLTKCGSYVSAHSTN